MKHPQQSSLVSAMRQPGFYPHPAARVELRETHISSVFLAGEFVYKIKKPVYLEFLDFSTLAKRHYYCTQEVSLNRRLAKGVYIGVVPITFKGGHYYLDGPGEIVEYAVMMHRLPDERSLLQLLRHKQTDPVSIENLTRLLAEYYQRSPTGDAVNQFGSLEAIRANCEENFQQIRNLAENQIDNHLFGIVEASTRAFLRRNRELFQDRVKTGRIRDCHGDLRCGHIYFENGIQIIDCIEFNDRFRYSDVASDLAFLVMDIEYEGFPEIARNLVDAYVRFSFDDDIYRLLDFYKCYRAIVKSKVNYIGMQGVSDSDYLKKRLQRDAQKYLLLAYQYAVRFTRPTLWVMCGLPAAGKSTIAQKLSQVLRIEVLRSDQIRKQLFDRAHDTIAALPFEKGIYTPEATALTYGKLLLLAQDELEHGHSVILDATFGRIHQRQEVLQLSRDMDVNIILVECTAPANCLKARLKQRETEPSLSDARLHHFKQFLDSFEPLDDITGTNRLRIDTTKPPDKNLQSILAHDYYLLSQLQV